MDIICDRKKLCDSLSKIAHAVSPKSTIPALEGILLQAKGESLSLTGYDLELGISTSIDCTVNRPGSVILSARLFIDIARRMDAEQISLTVSENNAAVLKGGHSEFKIMGMDAAEFPELPKFGGSEEGEGSFAQGTFALPQGLLKSMIDQTLFAVAVSDMKPAHKGILFSLSGGTLTLVAVDGYRLALRRETSLYPGTLSFIVPGKTMGELSKLLSDEEDELAQIAVAGKHIFFTLNGCFLFSRLLEGEFLDYEKAIPAAQKSQVTVDVKRLSEGLERVSLLIADRLRSPVRCGFAGGTVKLSCQTSMGGAVDLIDVELEGEEVEIGFNSKYFVDALKAAGCEKVKLLLNGPLSPMTIVPKEGDKFLFLVLPVRLS